MARLLIVGGPDSDDVPLALADEGHALTSVAKVEEAGRLLELYEFDAVILLAPGPAARTWCTEFRADGGQTPILIITSEPTTVARVASLDCGADDVLVRPIISAELRAHVRALTRRGPLLKRNEVVRGATRLDYGARRAWVGEREIALTPGEWRILEYLEMNAGRVASRYDILETLYGDVGDARKASLEVLIGRIRRKLGMGFIRTVRGRGYAVG